MNRLRLLCVDDDPKILHLYQLLLGRLGYEVVVAVNGRQALKLLEGNQIDAVISDFQMPGMNGGELAAEIKRLKPQLPVILVSGSESALTGTPDFVDVTIAKGAPVEQLIGQIEVLCCRQAQA